MKAMQIAADLFAPKTFLTLVINSSLTLPKIPSKFNSCFRTQRPTTLSCEQDVIHIAVKLKSQLLKPSVAGVIFDELTYHSEKISMDCRNKISTTRMSRTSQRMWHTIIFSIQWKGSIFYASNYPQHTGLSQQSDYHISMEFPEGEKLWLYSKLRTALASVDSFTSALNFSRDNFSRQICKQSQMTLEFCYTQLQKHKCKDGRNLEPFTARDIRCQNIQDN